MITQFQGSMRFLSNFYPSVVILKGREYRTVEHAYQAAKCVEEEDRIAIQQAKTPGEAKRLGRSVSMLYDWDSIRDFIMEDLVRQKFIEKGLRWQLLRTGDESLIEGNHWGDRYWGVCEGVGQNKLGKILMEIRKEIREEIRRSMK